MLADIESKTTSPDLWRTALIAALGVLAAALVGIELTRSAGNVASVWLATGVTIGLILRWPERRVIILVVSGAMIMLANMFYGDPVPVAAGLSVANVAGSVVIIAGLGMIGWKPSEVEDGKGILRFAAMALLAGPAVGAVIGALVIHLAYGAPYLPVAERWFLSDMIGNFILAPAVISRDAGNRLLRHWRHFCLWSAGLVGVGLASVATDMMLILLAVPPVMVVLASGIGIAAVGAAGALVAVGATWITVNGIGPVFQTVDGDLGQAIQLLQVFLAFSIGIGQLVAVLMAQRRRAEFDLQLYRTTIDNAPDGVLLTDLRGKFVLWNDKLLEILGTTEELLAGKGRLGRAEYRQENAAILARLAKGERIRGMPFRRLTDDGRPIVAELDGVPILNDGNFAGAAISIRDISHEFELRRQAEARTRELEAFLDAAAEGIVGTDANGNITIWNRAAEAIYGISAQEARGTPVRDLPGGDPTAVRDDRLRRLKRGEKFRNLESMRIARDGTERQVEVSINPIFDQDGNFAGTAGSLRDLSEIRRAEARSQESQRQLADATRAITDAIAIFDAEERLVHFNQNYARLVGGIERLRPGMSWEFIVRTNLESGALNLPEGDADREAWIEHRRRNRFNADRPFVLSLPDGTWLVGRDYPMENGGFISVRQDITELKQREAELARSNRDLEQFAFIASHDLREPLRKIQSFGGILSSEYADAIPEEARTFLGFMTNGADRMENLIDDLLQFSRAGRSQEAMEDVDLAAAVSEAMDNLLVLINDTDAVVNVGTLPRVRGRHGDIVRIFQNLIANGIKYRHPDRTPEISIGSEGNHDGMVRISVRDNGSGIAAEHAETVFEPFRRLGRRDAVFGTGMGLAIVRKLAVGLGGGIWLDVSGDRAEAGGACFRLELPECG